ncbi:hypothetical protein Tco_0937424 [Tanacetum coccineum]|uniref:Uncharacterized protein n=1 Tax=Tanacetum coccineum TaxID=301880 RepID=A0ABQ5DKD7_9ASTR
MSALKFTDSHNMVALLAKPTESEGFEKIATAKVKTVNGEVQLQALVDGKKVIITETSVRRVLKLKDAEGIECLPNADIFKQLALMGYANPHHTPIITQPSTSQPQKKQNPRKSKQQNTEVPQLSGSNDDAADKNVPTHSNDPLLSGEDRLQLKELLELCTKLQLRVLDLENTKTTQAQEISSLKLRFKRLEKKGGSRTHKLKRLFKVGRSAQVVSSEDEGVLNDEEVFAGQDVVEKEISTAEPVTTGGEVVTTASVVVSTAEVTTASATITTVDELTLAQTLIKIKAAKPKVVTTTATTTTTVVTRPKARGAKDKGKEKMIESEKTLKKKDQIMYDQEVALNIQAQLQAELEEEKMLARQKEEEANIALIES